MSLRLIVGCCLLLTFPFLLVATSLAQDDDSFGAAPSLSEVQEAEPSKAEDIIIDLDGGVFGEGFIGEAEEPDDDAWQQELIDEAREFARKDAEEQIEGDPYVLYYFPQHIGALRAAGDEKSAMRLSEIYLRHYPMSPDIGAFYFESKQQRQRHAAFFQTKSFRLNWADIATAYYRQQRGTSDEARQTGASLDAFEKIRGQCSLEEPDIEAVLKAAREFVDEYPQSKYCPAVVINACRIAQGPVSLGRDSLPNPILKICHDFVQRLERAGANGRAHRLVEAVYAWELGNGTDDEQKLRRSIAIYRKVAADEPNRHRKIDLLFSTVHRANSLQTDDALALRREIFLQILDTFPDHPRRANARYLYVETFLAHEGIPRALLEVRTLEDAGEANLDAELYLIANAHMQEKELAAAKTLCEEIITRFPKGPATGAAYVTLAQLHLRDDDREKAVAAYRQAAEAESFNTNYGIMDASNTKNEAHEFLGEHYMEQEDWQEALHWWETWEPSSWCGNCLWSMQARRKEMIEACQKKLDAQPSP